VQGTTTRNRLTRRLLPSLAVLSRRRAFAAPLDLADRVISWPFQEFRGLPPNRFRIRVGVRNRVLFNQAFFLRVGANTAIRIFALGLADYESRIVDLGCGCGRLAIALQRARFRGRYVGIDVDREMIDWCNENLGDSAFRFVHANTYNKIYNPAGPREPYRIPLPDSSQDLVMSWSLFSHLLEDDLVHYVNEARRMLRQGSYMAMTAFCLEDLRGEGRLGDRWTFRNRVGNAHVEDLRYPEAAVAYERSFLSEAARQAGFREVQIRTVGAPQSLLVART
jgi:SAM-dependent methyltransferase